jgi:hypothetical protein
MRKILSLSLLLLAPALAEAAAATCTPVAPASVSCACASGTCDAPSAAPTTATALYLGARRPENAPRSVEIYVSADSGQTLTAGTVTLLVYRYDEALARWAQAPSLTVTLTSPGSVRDLYHEGFSINTLRGYLMVIPSGVAVSSGGVTIKLLASVAK